MKTYSVTQIVEMTVSWTVRAESADKANDIATERTEALCNRMEKARKNIGFGDITDDYIPARDE
jgi:hypothetical protein